MATAYETKLKELFDANPSLICMTAENRATIRELAGWIPERFIDTGITEQTMVGAAAGLALRGRRPILHALAAFLTMRSFEFIRTDLGIASLPVTLVGFVPGFLSDGNGPTHQAIEDVSLMRGIPSMRVFCPADETELLAGLESTLSQDGPVYLRYNARPRALPAPKPFEYGKAECLSEGTDVTVLTYGMMATEAWEATQLLKEEGLSVRFLNMRTLAPVDEAAIVSASKETKLLVTVEDHFVTGGLASICSEVMVRHQQMAPLYPIGLDGRWFRPGLLKEVLEYEGFTGPHLARRILNRWKEGQ